MVGVKMSDCQIKFHVNIYSHIQYHSNYIIINRAFYQHFQVKIVIAHQTITQILKAKSISWVETPSYQVTGYTVSTY